MASSSASGSKLAELEEKLEGLEEQKAAELKKKQGTRDHELLVEGPGPSPGRDHSPVLW